MPSTAARTTTDIITGDAVALPTGVVGILPRAAALVIDALVYWLCWFGVTLIAIRFIAESLEIVTALGITAAALSFVVIPMTVEYLSGGYSLGKWLLGLRVVRIDGGGIVLRHSFVRALVGLVEIYGCGGAIAFVVALSNDRAMRAGDILAGTMVVSVRRAPIKAESMEMPRVLNEWAALVDVRRPPAAIGIRLRALRIRRRRTAPAAWEAAAHQTLDAFDAYCTPGVPRGHGVAVAIDGALAYLQSTDRARIERAASRGGQAISLG